MKIGFEIWIKEQHLPNEAVNLFNEAILCYKISAYRASLLMSYLGFQSVLRYRLITAPEKPDGIDKGWWDKNILKNLNDEKNWDSTVFSSIQKNNEKQIFLISDDIRREVTYWKDRRNDCAHAKDNIINYSHVEAFWLFIESHLAKFMVDGGKAGLLDKIKKHYDKTRTPPNTDVSYLIRDIPHAMNSREIPQFLSEVYKMLNEEFYMFLEINERHETYPFWKHLANCTVEDVRNGFYDFVKSDWVIFYDFINTFPNKFNEIASDKDFIRQFWTDKIWMFFQCDYASAWQIIKSLIENRIIPEDEIDDFVKKLNRKVKKNPPAEIMPLLLKTKYFGHMKESLFESREISTPPNGIHYANSNWKRIRFYITNIGLDELVVKELNSGYLAASYGTFFEGMEGLFEKDGDFTNEYKKIVEACGLTMPSDLA